MAQRLRLSSDKPTYMTHELLSSVQAGVIIRLSWTAYFLAPLFYCFLEIDDLLGGILVIRTQILCSIEFDPARGDPGLVCVTLTLPVSDNCLYKHRLRHKVLKINSAFQKLLAELMFRSASILLYSTVTGVIT